MELLIISGLLFPRKAAGYEVNMFGVVLDPYIAYVFEKPDKNRNANPICSISIAEILPGQWTGSYSVTFSDRGRGGPVSTGEGWSRPISFSPTKEDAFCKEAESLLKFVTEENIKTVDQKYAGKIKEDMETYLRLHAQGSFCLPPNLPRRVFRPNIYEGIVHKGK